jgi:hypothetical protein
MEPIADIDFEGMFPDLDHHGFRYVLHVSGLRELPAQTCLINFEGIENVEDLASYTDAEIDAMADRNSKRSPANLRLNMGLARTKSLKTFTHWVRKKIREGSPCDLRELTQPLIAELIGEINAKAAKKDSDTKLYYPDVSPRTTTRIGSRKLRITSTPGLINLESLSVMLFALLM